MPTVSETFLMFTSWPVCSKFRLVHNLQITRVDIFFYHFGKRVVASFEKLTLCN